MTSVAEVFETLKSVQDPEHPISITDPRMAIVKEEYISITEEGIQVKFKPTVPHCPMGGLIGILIRHRLEEIYPDSAISVSVIPGSHSREQDVNLMISDDARYSGIVEQLKERGIL
ncbi:MAG: iron-sulfur cluster assembly protein [Candidatus Thorarchaeota archaeon]